eukprot:g7225.t1
MGFLTQGRIWFITLILNVVNLGLFCLMAKFPWFSKPSMGKGGIVWIPESYSDRGYVNQLWRFLVMLGVVGGVLCCVLGVVLMAFGDKLMACLCGPCAMWLGGVLKAQLTFMTTLFQAKAAIICLIAANMLEVQDSVTDPKSKQVYRDSWSKGVGCIIACIVTSALNLVLLIYYPCAESDGTSWFSDSKPDEAGQTFFAGAAEEDEDAAVAARLSAHSLDAAAKKDPALAAKIAADKEKNLSFAAVFGVGPDSPADAPPTRSKEAEHELVHFSKN